MSTSCTVKEENQAPSLAAGGWTVSRWQLTLAALALALLALLGLYWSTVVSMAAIWWRSETYAHGMLVFPISFYMIWHRRQALARLEPRSSASGLVLLVLAALAWLTAYAADVLVVQQLALVSLLLALVCTLLGWRSTWAIAFPLAYLFFAVPAGESLTLPLQDFTAAFTVKMLRLTGMPVFAEGYHISIPSGEFEVAEACSGLRYLIASLALGCLYAYLSYRSLWRRLAFILLALVVPIIANGLRAYGIVMLAHLSSGRLATGVDHIIYGWFFFGLVVLLMFWIGSFWREPLDDAAPGAAADQPGTERAVTRPYAVRVGASALAGVALAALGPAGAVWLQAGVPAGAAPVAVQAPAAVPPWQGPLSANPDWQPVYVGADAVTQHGYRFDRQTVDLYIAFYARQRQGVELINSQNSLYNAKRWAYAGDRIRTVAPGAGQRVIETRIGAGSRQRLIWSWYWVSGWTTTSPLRAKVLQAWDRLSGSNRGSALVALSVDYQTDPEEAAALLTRFLEQTQAGVTAALAQPESRH